VETERRYYIETDTWTETDPETGETTTYTDSYRVYYDYYICTVTLEKLQHVPSSIHIMSEEQLSMYALYTGDAWQQAGFVRRHGKNLHGYDIPEEYLEDETLPPSLRRRKVSRLSVQYGADIARRPPSTVPALYHGLSTTAVGTWALGAQGLYNICTPVSASNAKPGDLCFLRGNLRHPGVSHVAIYVGDGMMIQAGNPSATPT
jgi:hypothetical protein